jgi:hypothetical protein
LFIGQFIETPACATETELTTATPNPPVTKAPMIARIFFLFAIFLFHTFFVGQFIIMPACASCGELTTAIPSPPAIMAPMIANIFLVFILDYSL